MSFKDIEIAYLHKEEVNKHCLRRPLTPPNTIKIKPLKNGEVIYLIKEGEKVKNAGK